MKTVRDAVITLKGNLQNRFNVFASPFDSSSYSICFDGLVVPCMNLICTYDQFNTEVCSMSNHAGRIEYVNYLAADKALLEKEGKVDYTSEEFWKDAPEGADIYIAGSDDYTESFIKGVTPMGYYLIDMEEACSKWIYQEAPLSLTNELVSVGIHRPKPSPIFTQDMADNGELPPVGCECMVLNSNMFKPEWELCTILFMGKFKVVYDSASAKERMADVDTIGEIKFKPIDTRTDEEKAIDEACLVIDDSKRCIKANTNIDCSVAMKAVIITLIKNGWSKS